MYTMCRAESMASSSLSLRQNENNAKSGRRSPIPPFASKVLDEIEPYVRRLREEGAIVRGPRELLQPLLVNRFHYSPLPNSTSWIRLVKLEPGDSAKMIRCSLHPVNLDERPKYTALSYSWRKDKDWVDGASLAARGLWSSLKDDGESFWGENREERTRPIFCDGKNMEIYPNLHNALLQLRRTQPGYYWIDAVCINQADTQEVNSQVQMMGRIYRSAELVTVWLGTCPSFLSPGMKQLESLVGKDPSEIDVGPKKARLFERPFGDTTLGKTILAAVYLLSRRWFRRVWVIQEVCLAINVMFILGEHRMSEQALIAAAEWGDPQRNRSLSGPGWYLMDQVLPYVAGYVRYIPFLLNSRAEFTSGGQVMLEDWLRMCKGRQTTDVKDYIYAGIALVQPESLSIDQSIQLAEPVPSANTSNLIASRRLWPNIHAEYSAGVFEILLNVAACLLSWPSAGRLLSVASRYRDLDKTMGDSEPGIGEPLTTIPSWFPNPASSFSYTHALQNRTDFAASTQAASDHRISADGTRLILRAARLGTVKKSRIQDGLVMEEEDMTDFIEFAKSLPRKYAPTGQCTLDVLANVLISGSWREQEPRHSAVKGLCHFIEALGRRGNRMYMEKKFSALKKNYASLKAAYPHQPWPAPDEDPRPLASLFGKRMRSEMKLRDIFVTTEGHLASGPTWLRPDDVLMIVKGGYVPYIFTPIDEYLERQVRKKQKTIANGKTNVKTRRKLEAEVQDIEKQIGKSDGWVLVGEAYVAGVMNGEADPGEGMYDTIDIV
ncbi:heterokaryon incompatibility protein-domain-containing protein [Biscogniauxia marginata]|nr:heterokaryon incompatibility protein-domain-containing protein [Biscogniauxia marginata]